MRVETLVPALVNASGKTAGPSSLTRRVGEESEPADEPSSSDTSSYPCAYVSAMREASAVETTKPRDAAWARASASVVCTTTELGEVVIAVVPHRGTRSVFA